MKWLKIIALNILIFVSLLWLVDHIWYVIAPISKPYAERVIRLREHPALSNIVLNKDSLIEDKESGELLFRTDGNGYILPFGGNIYADSIIFFVGGSTTECYSMPENKRFPYLVGQQLFEHGKNVCTVNAGVSGNNSLLSLNIILNKIAPAKPSKIVLMHAINDLNIYVKNESYWHVTNKYCNLRLNAVIDNNWLQRWLPTSYALTQKIKSTQKENNQPLELNNLNQNLTLKLTEDFKRNLNLFVLTCKQFGIEPILMTQARAFGKNASKKHLNGVAGIKDQGKLYFEQYINLFDLMNQTTRNVAILNQIQLIDLDAHLTNDTACFYDAIHYNSHGSNKAANIISNHLSHSFQ
jgi:hypothetical protein